MEEAVGGHAVAAVDAGVAGHVGDQFLAERVLLRIDVDRPSEGRQYSVPADNPTPDSLVYSLGHRTPQGIAWDDTGRLYAEAHWLVRHLDDPTRPLPTADRLSSVSNDLSALRSAVDKNDAALARLGADVSRIEREAPGFFARHIGVILGFSALLAVGTGLLLTLSRAAIATVVLAGLIAHWIAIWKVPMLARGLMPVLVIPLLTSILAKIEANVAGADAALMLDREGFETVLFYQALAFDAGIGAILLGFVPGLSLGMVASQWWASDSLRSRYSGLGVVTPRAVTVVTRASRRASGSSPSGTSW